jgi:hypothetical protein
MTPADGGGPCRPSGAVGGGPEVSVHDFGGDFDFDLTGQTARILVRGALTVGWQVSLTAAVSCSVPLPYQLVVVLGPTILHGELELTVTASAAVSGEFSVDFPVRIGASYDHGSVTNLSSAGASGQASFEPFTASLSVGVGAELDDKLFGIVGLRLGVGPEVTASLSHEDNRFCAKVEADVSVTVSAEAGRWGVGWSFDLGKVTFGPIQIWRSDGCNPAGLWVGTVHMHNDLEAGAIVTDATLTLAPDLWEQQSSPWEGFTGSQHAAVSGTFTYNSPGTPGVCGSTYGTANFNYDRTHYDTTWGGSVYPGFGGWFQLTIDGSDISVAGLQDVANYLLLPVSGVNADCNQYTDTFLEHPLYPPLHDECNTALHQGLQAEIDAILAADPAADFTALVGSNELTAGDDVCQVTWNLAKAPSD